MPFLRQEQLLPVAATSPECIPLIVEKGEKELPAPYGHDESQDSLAYSQDDEEGCLEKESSYQEAFKIHFEQEQETQELSIMLTFNKLLSTTKIDWDAAQFAMRMAVLLTLSSLFVLIRPKDYHYPDGMWVLVSVLFVCWFPSLDAASVIEKIMQRLIGTFVGAALGLSLGFFSLWAFSNRQHQAIFLACCIFVVNFMVIFVAGQCRVGRVKVIRRFAYATILCVLTFCICLLPFGYDDDPKWKHGVWRICNVIVGCILGAVGSIAVCPRSTTAVLFDMTTKQVKLAGEASEAVLLSAAAALSGRVHIERLAEELLGTLPESKMRWKFNRSDSSLTTKVYSGADVALTKYEDAIADWRLSKALFPLTRYDPFSVGKAPEKTMAFRTEAARTLARALRMQTTIVVLDGMVRNEGAEYGFDQDDFDLFAESGTLIRSMLTVPLDIMKSNEAAKQLFRKLEQTRQSIVKRSRAVAGIGTSSPKSVMHKDGMRDFEASLLNRNMNFKSTRMDDDEGLGIPKYAMGCHDNALLFLQLVEHLILRSLRLYQAFKHVEMDAVELNDDSIHPLKVV